MEDYMIVPAHSFVVRCWLRMAYVLSFAYAVTFVPAAMIGRRGAWAADLESYKHGAEVRLSFAEDGWYVVTFNPTTGEMQAHSRCNFLTGFRERLWTLTHAPEGERRLFGMHILRGDWHEVTYKRK